MEVSCANDSHNSDFFIALIGASAFEHLKETSLVSLSVLIGNENGTPICSFEKSTFPLFNILFLYKNAHL